MIDNTELSFHELPLEHKYNYIQNNNKKLLQENGNLERLIIKLKQENEILKKKSEGIVVEVVKPGAKAHLIKQQENARCVNLFLKDRGLYDQFRAFKETQSTEGGRRADRVGKLLKLDA